MTAQPKGKKMAFGRGEALTDTSPAGYDADAGPVVEEEPPPPRYRQTKVGLTEAQYGRARQLAALAGHPSISTSDVIRLAVARLIADHDNERLDLRLELVAQAHAEVRQYPGRRARGMPSLIQPRPH
jgi:hypothetical protein